MSEKIFINRHEISTKERSAALAHAANELGVKVLAHSDAGEDYRYISGHRNSLNRKIRQGVVPEGSQHIEITGMFPSAGTGELHRRADEIQAQLNNTEEKAA